MKKLVITAIINVILTTPSFANAIPFSNSGGSKITVTYEQSRQNHQGLPQSPIRVAQTSPRGRDSNSNSNSRFFVEMLKKQSEEIKKQSEHLEKIYGAIASNPQNLQDIQDAEDIFLKKLHLSYERDDFLTANSTNQDLSKIGEFENKFKEFENKSNFETTRQSINNRSQYAAAIDKFIGLKISENIEDRSGKILGLLKKIDGTSDLKGISELQTRLKIQLAMSQNETTQLQMAAHLRNVEQAFINQQKYKRNMKILDSKNMEMPKIRY
ncbi:type IV secretion system protein [Bartonella sp. CB189]|uniref:type IV secretion system protein n=1 Tax=Bartonella sp. CB189 TaxID=3112254 RepID=UPI002F96AD11